MEPVLHGLRRDGLGRDRLERDVDLKGTLGQIIVLHMAISKSISDSGDLDKPVSTHTRNQTPYLWEQVTV